MSARHAILFCENVWKPSFEYLARRIIPDGEGAHLYLVVRAIEEAGSSGATKADILRRTDILLKRADEAITTLCASKRVVKCNRPSDGEEVYVYEDYFGGN